ncbi:MAG: hypothetical protein R6U27_04315 [Desulfobacterales bacterium]
MEEFTKAQKGRVAIRNFKITADALALRGVYRPSGRSGQTLAQALRMLSPEIYGVMNDPRIIELKGLEYVIDRLPKGIEECRRIILTAQEELEGTSFEKIYPAKRRRASYRVSEDEICFVITRGISEIYDLITHLTFLNIEAGKIRNQMSEQSGKSTLEWLNLENTIARESSLSPSELDRAIWNLSMILGRTYHETMETYEYLESGRKGARSNRGLFKIIHDLGKRVKEEEDSNDKKLTIHFTPALKEIIGHQIYGKKWAGEVKERIILLNLDKRPLHIISANMHSVVNTLYGFAAIKDQWGEGEKRDIFQMFLKLRNSGDAVREYALGHGLYEHHDPSGSHVDCQIIDTAKLDTVEFHPDLKIDASHINSGGPVILVMDYAFGAQAFEVMDEFLSPFTQEDVSQPFDIQSISIMGKAGILPGQKGDIILATAHVIEGNAHNYPVDNDLKIEDFKDSANVYAGPIVTVLGTSLQNRDILEKFQTTTWNAVGLEMEGGHYQQAISAAIIRKHICSDIKLRYAYYASDNPLVSGQTLAYGAMGQEGIKPTYLISKVILEKIFKNAV